MHWWYMRTVRTIRLLLGFVLVSCDAAGPDPRRPATLARLSVNDQVVEVGEY